MRPLPSVLIVLACSQTLFAQDRWPSMPGYTEYTEALQARRSASVPSLRGSWTSETEYTFNDGSKSLVYDLKSNAVRPGAQTPLRGLAMQERPVAFGPQQNPARGRQFTQLRSPDGKLTATYADGNISLVSGDSKVQVTNDGNPAKRIKYGTASWVYGEELNQRYAFGFSPDSTKLWFYRFDESKVLDYNLTTGQGSPQNQLYTEAYPKPGQPNPEVDLYSYDLASAKTTKIQVREGAFSNAIGHYVYAIQYSADSKRLMFFRMNRQQNERELCAADLASGQIKTIDREANPGGWVEFGPLSDMRSGGRGARSETGMPSEMLINSEAAGYYNLYWLDTVAGTRRRVVNLEADVIRVLKADAASRKIWFLAGGPPANPYRHQLYVVNYDGSGQRLLTDPDFHHTIDINPAGTAFMDKAETSTIPPVLRACDGNGKVLSEAAKSSIESGGAGGFAPSQMFKFRSQDGTVDLWGRMDLPRNFDPSKRYPVLLSVYGGPLPGYGGGADSFDLSDPMASTGFIIVNIDGRATSGRGRAFRQAIYRKMGIVEMDDQAAGIDALKRFPFVDTKRVGVFGTSYGGYSSAMLLLRYPNLFAAASASSAVTQWANYDTTYTERYMDLLENNRDGYANSSCMKYAANLRGWLMIYYGTADDNVHPTNAHQLIQALQNARKGFEVQVGVDQGHTGLNFARMMEFFVERLVIDGPKG